MIIPFQAVYNASKAALSTFSQSLRLELQPFPNISVVELKTGGVKTNVINNNRTKGTSLPEKSIYGGPAKEAAEEIISGEWAEAHLNMTAEVWAEGVVKQLLRESGPPMVIWKGDSIWSAWFAGMSPLGWLDGVTKKMTGLSKVEEIIRRR